MDLAQVLRAERDSIVAQFVAELKRDEVPPPGLARSLLVDHIPMFLDEIISEVDRLGSLKEGQDTADTSITARKHGEQRWVLGYDLKALIGEYGILRHCILQAAKSAGASLSIDELDIVAKCLNVGVSEAVSEYIRFRDEELNEQRAQLQFLVEVGELLSSSLDYRSTLRSLTGLVVPRMADWCAIHLDGEAPPSPPAADLVKIVVPLSMNEHRLGTLTLAYSDPKRGHDGDLLLAKELARRAAVAVDNARLYELSQNERSRMEAATRAKDELIAMVSHELRSPLNAMLGWLRLLRSGALGEEKQKHALEVIERNANAQNHLIAELLDISKVITGKIRIQPSQVDFANIVDVAVEGMRPAAEAKRIELRMELDRESASLRGDSDRLHQVVSNVLANAMKFTQKGGHILVRLRRVESDIELTVQDDGEGIDASFLPRVFESFQQSDTSASRPHGGLGIGLSIAKHLVELHGGVIEAHSAGLGQGASFVIRLPISPLVSTTLGVSRIPAAPVRDLDTSAPEGLEGRRALIVDDDFDARELITLVLEGCGMEVQSAGGATEALALLERWSPDVIVSDIGMPNRDGYSLIRAIRTLPDLEKRATPAIALTAFAANEDRTRALVEGFDQHLAKPVEPGALVQALLQLARHPQR